MGPIHSTCGDALVGCINSDAFALPAQYTYGNAAPNLFHGPGLVDFDTSLGKAFRIREGMAFQLRADAYNTFNHVNWGNPNGVWNSPQFGSITTAGPMRVFEITGRLSF